jgi:uncharacterized damage-inducible protein DinB
MKRNRWNQALPLVMSLVCLAGTAAGQSITPSEKEQAIQYLNETRDGVVQAVKGLSEAQWRFKPGPSRWSIAEVVEHLGLIEDFFLDDVRPELTKSAATTPSADAKKVDDLVLSKILDRSTKYEAPPIAVPTGRWAPQEALQHFLFGRQQTVGFLNSAADLRSHTLAHPALGPLDGYQWVLAVAAHSARHTKQILEVKADPNFPAN